MCVYKAMVRSHTDYCSSVWAPYKKGDIEMLESAKTDFHHTRSKAQWPSTVEYSDVEPKILRYYHSTGISVILIVLKYISFQLYTIGKYVAI